ncbi:hypothetical protein [Candidatus Sodalis endolongispinus]|uniref:hypothetical protein n=1 Tax=Candidatus Sodalis endolongispinus TaxID=2812662 RepID=UPI0024848A24|nr:hypothetical protein [Candidatus Sodalis endolongispinus]
MTHIDHDGLPLPQRYGAILTIVLSVSIAVLDGAIANVSLPTIARELHASPAASIWVVNAYQLAIIVSLLFLRQPRQYLRLPSRLSVWSGGVQRDVFTLRIIR